ncbi:MAG: hypothetical protein QME07_07925, partial [bacterium]|nr:hypothetical protein [bacterium]
GYSVCDYCKGVLHLIEKPPICDLTRQLAEFLGLDAKKGDATLYSNLLSNQALQLTASTPQLSFIVK